MSSSSFSSFFRAGSAGWMAKRHDSSAHPKLERVLNKTSKNQTSMADLEAAPVADVPIQDAALCSFYRKIRPLPCKEKFKIPAHPSPIALSYLHLHQVCKKKQVDKSSINLSIIDGQIWSHWIISTFGVEKISAKEVWCYNRKSQRNFRKDGS